jgi:bacteriorhodopsin
MSFPTTPVGWACLILGAVVMWLTMMFVTRYLKSDANAKPGNLAKFLGILLGGTVVGFATAQLGAGTQEFAWYAIGLGVGLVLYAIAFLVDTGGLPTRH